MSDTKSIVHHLYSRALASPALVALKYKENGRWLYYRWSDVLQIVESLAQYFSDLGIETGDRIAIISETRPEWFLSDISILANQSVTVPIYPNLLESDIQYILNDAKPRVLILEDASQLQKWNNIKENCDSVETVLIIDANDVKESSRNSWSEALTLGRESLKKNPNAVKSKVDAIQLNDVATILYTSGTTGNPKGVVLKHEQIMSELTDVFRVMPANNNDLSLTFLPLAHILGRVETWGSIYSGFCLGFAESVDRIRSNLVELKPTFIIGVPRIFEKLYSAILAHVETKPTSRRMFHIAAKVGRAVAEHRSQNESIPWTTLLEHQIFDRLVFQAIRAQLGGRIRFCISGGAPLSPEISKFFCGAGILILEGYGLTETTAGVTFNTPLRYKFGTVGPALDDVNIRIATDGEILIKSKKVMSEYYHNEEATREAFDGEYFKTGDIGEIDADGFLKITDRKKDLIKTAGGKYVAPQRLEGLLKLSPYISNVLIHGDQKKYIVALITLNMSSIKSWAEPQGIDLKEAYQHEKVRALIRDAVAEVNTQLASFESIKKFEILANDFSIESGELTPSLKVKRKFCDEKYKNEIAQLYE